MKTAILVDGGFFIKRYRSLTPNWQNKSANDVVRSMYGRVLSDLRKANKGRKPCRELYRVFFYDCQPLNKRLQNPISAKGIDFGKSKESLFRLEMHDELKKFRKVALRLGRISDTKNWQIKADVTKKLLKREMEIHDLVESDVFYEVRQKGVDMKIGLDIASLSYKQNVDQIILIAGDSDFVPASKLARREGIDFVLDPMDNHVNEDLHEHIDGLLREEKTKPIKKMKSTKQN